jgi:hypothetical protein
MAEDKDSYSVEVREPTRGGDDYTEEHYDFDTAQEVRDYIKNDMHEDESVHSVLFYRAGTTGNPRDVTHKF